MDVRSCKDAGTTSREALVRSSASRLSQRALSGARHQTSCFLLTGDLHGCRLKDDCRSQGSGSRMLAQGRDRQVSLSLEATEGPVLRTNPGPFFAHQEDKEKPRPGLAEHERG